MLPAELDASFSEVAWDVCWAQCRVVEGVLQFLLELLDVCLAVRVAEQAGEMLDGVRVMVCSVVGGIGDIFWYPVRGLMGLRSGGYVLEVCVVWAEVGDLEGWQLRCVLVYCLVVDLTISVLVPVGLLFHYVELDVGGKASKSFPEQQWRRGGLVEWLSCYAEEQVCVDSGVYHEPDLADVQEVGG